MFDEKKKLSFDCILVCAVIFTMLGDSARALSWAHRWDNANGTSEWTDGANWDEGTVPTISDTVYFPWTDSLCRVSGSATCRNTAGPGQDIGTHNIHLDIIPGGFLTVKNQTWNEGLLIGYGGQGALNMYGGNVRVEGTSGAGGECQIGGTGNSDGRLFMAASSAAFYTEAGLWFDRFDAGGSAILDADAGLIDTDWLGIGTGGQVNLNGGTIEIRRYQDITDYINAGKILPYGGSGMVIWDYDVTKAGVTTINAGYPTWANSWTNANGTMLWSDSGNWDKSIVPGAGDMVRFSVSNSLTTIDSSATCWGTSGPGHETWTVNSHLDILPGGSLTVTSTDWNVPMLIGYAGQGSLNMYGGSVDVQTVEAWVGGVPSGDGRILIEDGTFRTGGALVLNRGDYGGRARIFVNGGLMDLGWLGINGDGVLDITDGIVEIRTDMVSNGNIPNYIANGMITAYGGVGNVRYDYGATKAGVTTIWAEDTGVAIGAGTIWDVKDSFSDNSSSNDVWSYGLTLVGVIGDFWPMEQVYDPFDGQADVKARYFHSDFPDCVVAVNNSAVVKNNLQPGQIGMQPNKAGLGWRESLVRWKSPADGTIRVQCTFDATASYYGNGHFMRLIRADGTGHTNLHQNWEAYSTESFDFLINVHKGDKLDFMVSNGPEPSVEIVPFDCTITAQDGFGQVEGWDIVKDFSTTQNPSGQWTYGYGYLSLLDESQFVPNTRVTTDAAEDNELISGTTAWKDYTQVYWPQKVMYNITNEPISELSAWSYSTSRVALLGGSGTLNSAIRWTSPGDGTVIVSGCFGPGYEAGYGFAWIINNDTSVIDSAEAVLNTDQLDGTPAGFPFVFEVTVNEGDTLDFVAGTGGYVPESALPLHCTIFPKSDFVEYDRTGEATMPSPENGSDGVSKYPILAWTAGSTADSHDIYFGTNLTAVANDMRSVADLSKNGSVGLEDLALLVEDWLEVCTYCPDFDGSGDIELGDFSVLASSWKDEAGISYMGNVVETRYVTPGPLTVGQTYYWRVDEVDGLDIIKGQVLSFTVNGVQEVDLMVLRNPDMGWVLQESYPVALEEGSTMFLEPDYAYDDIDYVTVMITWSDIETSQGVYDFSDADTAYNYWVARGKKITLRLSTESWLWWNNDVPSRGLGVPQYVLNTLSASEKQVKNMDGIDFTVVDARDAFYLARLDAFLDTVAAHFAPAGAKPVGLVDLGGFGVWGEWHSGFAYPGLPSDTSARTNALQGIIDTFSASFSDNRLALSYSHDPDGPTEYYDGTTTYYNDFVTYSAFDYALGKSNVTFRRNGCGSAISANERLFADNTFALLTKEPFTCEFAGAFSGFADYILYSGNFSVDEAIDDALDLHPNQMVVMGWDQSRAKLFLKSRPDAVARGLRTMGYRFVPISVSVSESISIGQSIAYNLSWINEAVGRAARDYELQFEIRDLNGNVINEYSAGAISTSTWIAGGGPYATNGSIPNVLSAGTYRLCVSMYDAATDTRIELPLINNFDTTYEIAILTVN